MPQSVLSIEELLDATERAAYHMEMRDVYAVSYEQADFEKWQRTGRWNNPVYWQPWIDTVSKAVARGVAVRRIRILSMPASASMKFEFAGTENNLTAGEDVRWLPRRRAADLALPGTDFWVFDGKIVRWGFFDGDGEFLDNEVTEEPAAAKLCTSAFDAAWERATPHSEFTI
jgi:hypothetical protein